MEILAAVIRSLLWGALTATIVYLGVYALDSAVWSHVLAIGSSSLWATVMGGIAFVYMFVTALLNDGHIDLDYPS